MTALDGGVPARISEPWERREGPWTRWVEADRALGVGVCCLLMLGPMVSPCSDAVRIGAPMMWPSEARTIEEAAWLDEWANRDNGVAWRSGAVYVQCA